jgi:hypothetical protein
MQASTAAGPGGLALLRPPSWSWGGALLQAGRLLVWLLPGWMARWQLGQLTPCPEDCLHRRQRQHCPTRCGSCCGVATVLPMRQQTPQLRGKVAVMQGLLALDKVQGRCAAAGAGALRQKKMPQACCWCGSMKSQWPGGWCPVSSVCAASPLQLPGATPPAAGHPGSAGPSSGVGPPGHH